MSERSATDSPIQRCATTAHSQMESNKLLPLLQPEKSDGKCSCIRETLKWSLTVVLSVKESATSWLSLAYVCLCARLIWWRHSERDETGSTDPMVKGAYRRSPAQPLSVIKSVWLYELFHLWTNATVAKCNGKHVCRLPPFIPYCVNLRARWINDELVKFWLLTKHSRRQVLQLARLSIACVWCGNIYKCKSIRPEPYGLLYRHYRLDAVSRKSDFVSCVLWRYIPFCPPLNVCTIFFFFDSWFSFWHHCCLWILRQPVMMAHAFIGMPVHNVALATSIIRFEFVCVKIKLELEPLICIFWFFTICRFFCPARHSPQQPVYSYDA